MRTVTLAEVEESLIRRGIFILLPAESLRRIIGQATIVRPVRRVAIHLEGFQDSVDVGQGILIGILLVIVHLEGRIGLCLQSLAAPFEGHGGLQLIGQLLQRGAGHQIIVKLSHRAS